MVSNQVLQKAVEELKAITKVNLAVLSLDGTVAAATSEDIREKLEQAVEFGRSPADSQMIQEVCFFKVYDDRNPEYIILSWGGRRKCVHDWRSCGLPDSESDYCI